jgi:hypothetical protein
MIQLLILFKLKELATLGVLWLLIRYLKKKDAFSGNKLVSKAFNRIGSQKTIFWAPRYCPEKEPGVINAITFPNYTN